MRRLGHLVLGAMLSLLSVAQAEPLPELTVLNWPDYVDPGRELVDLL